MALYSQMYLYIDDILLCENTTIETSLESDIQDVMTIQGGKDGWKGITPSPVMRTVTANNVIPRTGTEIDFESLMLNNTEIQVTIQENGGSGKKMVSKGYITNVPRSAGVGQTVTISFTFRGTPGIFE